MYICVVVIGAVVIQDCSSATVTDNTFQFNVAGVNGGAVEFLLIGGPPVTTNANVFKKNIPNDVVHT